MADGNIAKMREALEASRAYFVALRAEVPNTQSQQYLTQRIADLDSALAAPPRNCDRFQTASEVSAYWNSNVRTVPLPHDAYGMHIDGETYPTFLDWLMAPTKEARDA